MSIPRILLWLCPLLMIGCGGGNAPPPSNVNPYAAQPPAQSSAPIPLPGSGRSAASPGSGRSAAGGSGEASVGAETGDVDIVPGYSAEMGVPLSFLEYARFARRSAEMLSEMSKIHKAVSETGKAEPYQERWGDLTAEHTSLVREVMESAYPPAELARELRQNALPRLDAELKFAQAVMENFEDLEGGLAHPFAEARRIFDHLAKNLTEEEQATMPSATLAE